MRIKRLICMLLVCATMICGSFTLAGAVQAPGDIIWMEDMEWDLLDPSTVIYDGAAPLTTGSVNTDISPFSTKAISQISLKSGDALTFNCSYSPSSASMDFGVIASSGQFYYQCKGGQYQPGNQDQPSRKLCGGDQEQFFTNCSCGRVCGLLTLYVPHSIVERRSRT